MKPAISPVSERALRILHSGLRRKEAAALLAGVKSLVLMLAQSADGRAWFAHLSLRLVARQVKPPTFDDCAYACHGIRIGLRPMDAAENDKHL